MNVTYRIRPLVAACLPVLCLFTGAILAGACSGSTEPTLTRWEADLTPLGGSTLSGRAVAVTQFGRTQASVLIEGGEEGRTYGWRINAGTCLEEGAIQGGAAQYPPLSAGADGIGSAEASIGSVFPVTGRFAARVFLAEGQEPEELVACGNLELVS